MDTFIKDAETEEILEALETLDKKDENMFERFMPPTAYPNVISTCHVLSYEVSGVVSYKPIIYLSRPNLPGWEVLTFMTPFAAKSFLKFHGAQKVAVRK